MKDALGQQINVGDYVAYANRFGMLVVRVSRVEEYDRKGRVRIVGRYAAATLDKWELMYNGYNRHFELTGSAIKLDPTTLPPSLIEMLQSKT